MQSAFLPTRLSLLASLALTFGMIVWRVVSYAPLLSLRGAKSLIGEAAALLLCYGIVVAWPQPRGAGSFRPQFATVFGVAGGLIQSIHLLVERFCALPQPWDGIVTLSFMLGTFLVWGYAGYRARGLGMSFFAGCLAALWSAIVTMTIAVLVGSLLEFFLAPIPLETMNAWAEFQRSGWKDLSAFSIANTIDEVSTHLLVGPIVACFFGPLGYALHMLTRQTHRKQDLRS
jgi:hypothetical protein